jgi:ribonuclease P protein component
LPKSDILRGKRAIARVFQEGSHIKGKYCALVFLCGVPCRDFKIAFAASRGTQTAVARNRLKRRLREAFRAELIRPRAACHAILIAHVKMLEADFSAICAELKRLFTRAGIAG